jgi:predicted restriction endonuclease
MMDGKTSANARNRGMAMSDDQIIITLRRNSVEARKAAKDAYGFCCCLICGLELKAALELAHLDHHAGNNDPDNLGWFCSTHHRMYDCGLYPIEAIKLMRAHWQLT